MQQINITLYSQYESLPIQISLDAFEQEIHVIKMPLKRPVGNKEMLKHSTSSIQIKGCYSLYLFREVQVNVCLNLKFILVFPVTDQSSLHLTASAMGNMHTGSGKIYVSLKCPGLSVAF